MTAMKDMVVRLNDWWDRAAERFELETGKVVGPELTESESIRFADILEDEAHNG